MAKKLKVAKAFMAKLEKQAAEAGSETSEDETHEE